MFPNLCKRNMNTIINYYSRVRVNNNNNKIVPILYYSSNSNSITKYSFEGHTWFNINNDKDTTTSNNNNQVNGDGYIVKIGITDKFDHPSIPPTINFVDFSAKPGEIIQDKYQDIFYISTPGFDFYVGSPIPGKILKYNLPLRSNPNKLSNNTSKSNNDQEEENIKSKWIVEMKIKDLSEFNKLLTKREYERACIDHRQTMLSWMHSWNIYKKFDS